jgi:hypothetical protein
MQRNKRRFATSVKRIFKAATIKLLNASISALKTPPQADNNSPNTDCEKNNCRYNVALESDMRHEQLLISRVQVRPASRLESFMLGWTLQDFLAIRRSGG